MLYTEDTAGHNYLRLQPIEYSIQLMELIEAEYSPQSSVVRAPISYYMSYTTSMEILLTIIVGFHQYFHL